MKKNQFAFTLIELLIVVAIIAILAAIAVPNFLEAQTRSKVSRTVADMRNLATALESYFVDSNHYPPAFSQSNPFSPYNVPNELSTPISYVTATTSFFDIFSIGIERQSGQFHRYGYIVTDYLRTPIGTNPSQAIKDMLIELCGKWRMDSYGPDRMIPPGGWYIELSYDPTNGTVSIGAIYRSQKDPEGIQK